MHTQHDQNNPESHTYTVTVTGGNDDTRTKIIRILAQRISMECRGDVECPVARWTERPYAKLTGRRADVKFIDGEGEDGVVQPLPITCPMCNSTTAAFHLHSRFYCYACRYEWGNPMQPVAPSHAKDNMRLAEAIENSRPAPKVPIPDGWQELDYNDDMQIGDKTDAILSDDCLWSDIPPLWAGTPYGGYGAVGGRTIRRVENIQNMPKERVAVNNPIESTWRDLMESSMELQAIMAQSEFDEARLNNSTFRIRTEVIHRKSIRHPAHEMVTAQDIPESYGLRAGNETLAPSDLFMWRGQWRRCGDYWMTFNGKTGDTAYYMGVHVLTIKEWHPNSEMPSH